MTDRNISCFFVRELLPLHLEGKLDENRRSEVNKHLTTCQHCTYFFENIKAAREALTELSKTKVSPTIIEYLKQEHTFWTEFYRKINWSKWPNSLKWGLELAVVTFVLALTIHVFPWIKFARAVKSLQPQAPLMTNNPVILPQPAPQLSPVPTPVTVVAASKVLAKPTVIIPSHTPTVETGETDEQIDAKTKEEESDSAGENQGDQEKLQAGAKRESGFVWRGTLRVDEVSDELTERVTSTILEMGGTKAGEVELGWHRGNQRYYHFILPEDNYERLLSVLNSEGLVDLKKIRHPRVMKSGFMRIIMTVEESSE
jgi:hypothetical protein